MSYLPHIMGKELEIYDFYCSFWGHSKLEGEGRI